MTNPTDDDDSIDPLVESVEDECPTCGAYSIDPLVESVEDECPTCGAYMLNPALHADFHRRQREQFINLDHLARQYVSPPRYG